MNNLPPIPTETDVKDSRLLVRLLRGMCDYMSNLFNRITKLENQPPTQSSMDYLAISKALGNQGIAPLNVQGLAGQLGQPQPALLTPFVAAPTGLVLQALYENQLIVVPGTSDTLYRVLPGNPKTLSAFSFSSPANMVTTDTIQNITATKTFTTTQVIVNSQNSTLGLAVANVNVGASAQAVLSVQSDAGGASWISHSLARIITRYGLTLGGFNELSAFTGILGLVIGTQDNVPLVLGTNDIERLRLTDNNIIYSFNNGASAKFIVTTENITLSTGSVTTDSSSNMLPGNSLTLGVVVIVTTAITTAATLKIGDATQTDRFNTLGSMTLGSQLTCLNHWQGSVATNNAGPVTYSQRPIRLTADVNPGAGRVRVIAVSVEFVPPSS